MADKLEPLPCPFCGGEMVECGGDSVRHRGETWEHCPLIGKLLPMRGWNHRAPDDRREAERKAAEQQEANAIWFLNELIEKIGNAVKEYGSCEYTPDEGHSDDCGLCEFKDWLRLANDTKELFNMKAIALRSETSRGAGVERRP